MCCAAHSYLTHNQKQESVGDGDRKFCHRMDSVEAKTGRYVLHHGSILAARKAAPVMLGHLARSTARNNKLPSIPSDIAGKGHEAEIGNWAAILISTKPKPGGTWERAAKVSTFDTRRPTLGMREISVPSAVGSDVQPPVAFKQPRTNPMAAAKARCKRKSPDPINDDANYASFNEGFGTNDEPLRWDGSSKRPRRRGKTAKGVGDGDGEGEAKATVTLSPESKAFATKVELFMAKVKDRFGQRS